MAEGAERRFGPHNKPLAALTDEELLQEVQRRRRKRGVASEHAAAKPEPAPTQIAKYLANLELKGEPTLPEVEAAFARLQAKYRPFLQADDAGRRAAARKLLDSLQHAYDRLKRHLDAGEQPR